RDPRVLFHLVLAERLARVEHHEHRPSSFVLVHDVRVERASGSVDRAEVPVLHWPNLLRTTLARCRRTSKPREEHTMSCRASTSGGVSSARSSSRQPSTAGSACRLLASRTPLSLRVP